MSRFIAIVGRPNVGKSTLFNGLTKSRHALVLDEDGVTRDCQYGECILTENTSITLVDTAGLVGGRLDGIGKVVEEAAWRVIEDCHAVLMVVDGSVGITAEDQALAKSLRGRHDNIILAVNKIDGEELVWMVAECHRLGFAQVFAISALHNKGLKPLKQALESMLPPEEAFIHPEQEGLRLTILGRPNVGKSTLVNTILGEEKVVVYDQPGTTRDCIATPCIIQGKSYVLVDTAGVRRRKQIDGLVEMYSVIQTLKALNEADVVVVVLNAEEGIVEQDLRLLRRVIDAGRCLVVGINKWDTLNAEARVTLENEIARKMGFVQFAETVVLSAKRGKGLGELLKAIQKTYERSRHELSTAAVTEALKSAVTKQAPPVVGRFRIKLRYAHVISNRPLMIMIHGNQTEQLSDSYKRYLISQFRQAFGLVGVPMRLQFRNSNNPYQPS